MRKIRPGSMRAIAIWGASALLFLGGCSESDEQTVVPDGAAVTVPDAGPDANETAPGESSEGTENSDGSENSDDADPDAAGDPAQQDDAGAETVDPKLSGIGMDEASQIAIAEFGGTLDSIEPDTYNGIEVWEVELDDTDLGIDLEVLVDRESGEILHYEED